MRVKKLRFAPAALCPLALALGSMFSPPAAAQATDTAVQQIFLAFYGRPGDPAGVRYWASQATGGVSSILNQFSSSIEANQLFAGMSNEGKITFVYRVLFNRDPESAGLSYWAAELSSGRKTLAEISYTILTGAVGTDLTMVNNKVTAALQFARDLESSNATAQYSTQADILLARNWMASINESPASLTTAQAGVAALIGRIQTAGSTNSATGVLATPSTAAKDLASSLQFASDEIQQQYATAKSTKAGSQLCFGVPDGYTALSGATVTQIDAFGLPGGSATADNCGIFVTTLGAMTSSFDIAATGYKSVRTSVAAFQDPDKNNLPDPLTLIPTTSSYLLSGLRLSGGNTLSFNVTDSATNKAVLGLTASQVSVRNNAAPVSMSAFGYSASATSSNPASVAMVLDASGSMGSNLSLAAAAASLFLTRKAASDEVSVTVFDNKVSFLNQAGYQSVTSTYGLSFTDGTGAALTPIPTVSGYSANPLFAEQMLKLYDVYSNAWKKTDAFFRVGKGSYPWNGSTALYSAGVQGVGSLSSTANRRYSLILTDGYDNASGSNTATTVINTAKPLNATVHTIGVGSSVNATDLRSIASSTGGSFTQLANSSQISNLSAVFDAIRTNIVYDYSATLATLPGTGSVVTLSVDVGGTVLSESVTAP